METTQTNLSWLWYLVIIGPSLVGFAGIFLAFYMSYKAIVNKQRQDEKAEAYKKLNDFYCPFEISRKKVNLLYRLFIEGKGASFHTLPALLKGETFSENDQKLLAEIIRIDEQLEKIILEKSGLIDTIEMRDLMSEAAIHFHIMSQAFNGQLRGEPDRFTKYGLPKELDTKISERIDVLKERLKKLNGEKLLKSELK